jgi:TolA-binding protein
MDMRHRRVLVALITGVVVALPAPLSAQQSRPAPKANQVQPESDIEELTPGQIRRAQELQRQQDLQRGQEQLRSQERQRTQEQQRAQERAQDRAQDREPPAPKSAAPKAPPAPATSARAVACSGAFAKDSSHLKLAVAFNSLNITFTEVDGPERAKVMASVLFPNDAKKRLEVWWQNPAARSGTYLIVINGQSTWTAPKGRSSSRASTRTAATPLTGRAARS